MYANDPRIDLRGVVSAGDYGDPKYTARFIRIFMPRTEERFLESFDVIKLVDLFPGPFRTIIFGGCMRRFFLDRDKTIIDLSVQLSNNLTKYSQRVTQQGDALPMDLSPPEGYLIFKHLEIDDQVFVSFAINPAMVESRENLLHIILIYVNGNHYTSLVNTLQR